METVVHVVGCRLVYYLKFLWNKALLDIRLMLMLMLMLCCCSSVGSGGTNQFIWIQINIDTLPSNPIIDAMHGHY